MRQNMTVVDECSNNVRITEIHMKFHLGIWPTAAPVRDIDCVAYCRIVNRLTIDLEYLEMNLMNVEDVIFCRAIFNHPILDCAGMYHNIRLLGHAENCRVLSFFCNVEAIR